MAEKTEAETSATTVTTVENYLTAALDLLDRAARLQRTQHNLDPEDIEGEEADLYQVISHAATWVSHILRGTDLSQRRRVARPAHSIRALYHHKRKDKLI